MSLKRRLSIVFILLANIMLFAHAVIPHDHHVSSNTCSKTTLSCDHSHTEVYCDESDSHKDDHHCCFSNIVFNSDEQKNSVVGLLAIPLDFLNNSKILVEKSAVKAYFAPYTIDDYVLFISKDSPLRAPPSLS